MSKPKLFIDLEHEEPKTHVNTWERKIVGRATSIFYKKQSEEEASGFLFYVVESVGSHGQYKDPMLDPECEIEVLFHGIVTWDGLRHLFAGHKSTENEGYLYYPSSANMARIFLGLRDLEYKYCHLEELED